MLKVRYDSCHIVTCFSVGKMTHMEQELIKRHNIKMMNEMQEVVRQIKQAKTKNDEILRDYHKKQTDLTRSVLEIAEK
jgi:di/tripeptidase